MSEINAEFAKCNVPGELCNTKPRNFQNCTVRNPTLCFSLTVTSNIWLFDKSRGLLPKACQNPGLGNINRVGGGAVQSGNLLRSLAVDHE